MKQRAEQLINGNFEYEVKPPLISPENIKVQAGPGQVVTGSFTIESPNERKVRGFVHSSNPRVTFDPVQFFGLSSKIMFQADLTGLGSDEETDGAFTICTDRGEYTLPYLFVCSDRTPSGEKDLSMPDPYRLCEMAREDMAKAAALFDSEDYRNFLEKSDKRLYAMYRELTAANDAQTALEEFLITCGRKKPVELTLDENAVKLERPRGSVRSEFTIRKNGWGCLPIRITSDSRFLRPEKKELSTLSFVGDEYRVGYIIDTNFLHGGINMGRISVSTSYGTLYLEVTVDCHRGNDEERSLRVRKLMQKKLLTLYMDLRMKKIEMSSWVERSLSVISSYKRAGGDDVFASLFMVQLHYAEGKRMKAGRLLQEIGTHSSRFTNNEQYAYYLYLTTFFDRDQAYVDRVEARIQQLFLQQRDSWIMQWVLLYLQEKYLRNDQAKIEAIAAQVRYGCSSPIMYLEAAQIYRKDPYQLRKLGSFEIKLLLFMAKYRILTEELAFQAANLAMQGQPFEPKLFRILKSGYELTGSKDLLRAICQLLINGQKKSREYFEWYALGVSEDVRITGLYEYYMETMDTMGIEKMPQVIRMYFAYNNSLSYHRKAAVYRDISDNRDNVPQVYRSSRTDMEHFVVEQLGLGRVDRNLAVLYERFLTRRLLNRNLAEQLAKILFTFEVTCKNPEMSAVVVVHDCLKEPEETPLKNGQAKVRIYAENAGILLKDRSGQLHSSDTLYQAERYVDSPLLITYCRELVPDNPGLVLYITSRGGEVNEETLQAYIRGSEYDMLRDWYRDRLRLALLDYYARNDMVSDRYEFLRSLNDSDYVRIGKGKLVALLAQEGLYEKAFSLIEQYGCENVDLAVLVRICSQNVLGREYEEDDVLLAYCSRCYTFGKYDDNILTYLLMYYDGPIEEMKRLWHSGRQNDMDTMALEEKILSLILFTRSGTEDTEQIYLAYRSKMGRKRTGRAYLNLKAYEYLIRNLPVNDVIFEIIETNILREEQVEDVCKLALLRYFSGLPSLGEHREHTVEALLKEYDERDIRFDFYRKFPYRLRRRCQLEDKVFLEYVADPSHTVIACFRRTGEEGEFDREPMKNAFEGIFVKEFILFETETLECYIEEYNGDELINTSSRRILSGLGGEGAPRDRFAMLGEMSRYEQDGQMQKLSEGLENYRQLDYLTQKIFLLV